MVLCWVWSASGEFSGSVSGCDYGEIVGVRWYDRCCVLFLFLCTHKGFGLDVSWVPFGMW